MLPADQHKQLWIRAAGFTSRGLSQWPCCLYVQANVTTNNLWKNDLIFVHFIEPKEGQKKAALFQSQLKNDL